MSVLTFVGAGQMASALTFPAMQNGHEVRLVGTPLDREIIEELRRSDFHLNLKRTLPHGVRYYQVEQAAEALRGADAVLNGVSSFGLDWFCDQMLPILPEGVPVLSVTKGMLDTPEGKLLPYPFVMEQRLPRGKHLQICAIGGPCTSYELADRDHSHVTFCGRDMQTLRALKQLFACDYYHVSLSTDIVGVECAVAMKNAYALGVSLAVGMAEKREGREGVLHYNSQAALFGQSLREMAHLLALCGGGAECLSLGGGDLYVTIFGGRTRRLGTLLGRGMTYEKAMEALAGVTLESVVIAARTARAVRSMAARGEVSLADFPLLMHVESLLEGGTPGNIPWEAFTSETGEG